MGTGIDTDCLWTINYLDIVDDELLEASQEFYKKNTALYGIDELL